MCVCMSAATTITAAAAAYKSGVIFIILYLSLCINSQNIFQKIKKRIKQKYPHKLASENQPTTTTNLKKSKKNYCFSNATNTLSLFSCISLSP